MTYLRGALQQVKKGTGSSGNDDLKELEPPGFAADKHINHLLPILAVNNEPLKTSDATQKPGRCFALHFLSKRPAGGFDHADGNGRSNDLPQSGNEL